MSSLGARTRTRSIALVCLILLAAAAAAGVYVRARTAPEGTGSIASPASGAALTDEGLIRGEVALRPGTFALVTIWSAATQQDYAVQLVGLSGPFSMGIENDIPNHPGDYELRLWLISKTAAQFAQENWPQPKDGCAAGFSGLDQQRSGFESDPFRIVSRVPVTHGAAGVDAAEAQPDRC